MAGSFHPFRNSSRDAAEGNGYAHLVQLGLAALVLLLVGLLIFENFVFGDRVLLYKDIGADSINDSYPYFVHLSDYIRHEGIPSWSFCVGMGQSLFYRTGDLIWHPIIWLPRDLIARALVFEHLGKTLVAGLFFLGFLRLRGLDFCAALLGSLLLAFSSYMCMGSCWLVNADEVVGFSFLLCAAEMAVTRGRWLYLPLAVAALGLVTAFHLYLAALLLVFYVPGRLLEKHGWQPSVLFSVSVRLSAAALLGTGLSAVIWFGSVYCLLNSPRGSGAIANFTWGPSPSFFQLESARYYATAALRFFSSDLAGDGGAFRGWENYFEAPIISGGLLTLLLLPQVFFVLPRRRRVLGGLFLALILVPLVLPWFRSLFWLFRGGYVRTLSLFAIFGIITLSMTAFSRCMRRGRLSLWALGVTLVVLLGVLYLPVPSVSSLVDRPLRGVLEAFLLLYGALLAGARVLRREAIARWMILFLAAGELIFLDRITVNRRTVTKQELTERIGFNDRTVEAVRDIKASDPTFFRTTKEWGSGLANAPSLNDAMVFGFYGTLSYSSFNSLNYIKFLEAMDALSGEGLSTDAQWSLGLVAQPLLSVFACEKYAITTNPAPYEAAERYEFVRAYGRISLFRNKSFLPFGLIFGRCFAEESFLQMPPWARQLALLCAVAVPGKDIRDQGGLSQISLDDLKERMRDISVPDLLAERRSSALSIRSFRQTRIDGTVRLEEKGIMVLQMPFDAGWHAWADGRTVPVLKVDAGLTGVVLEGGQHVVEMRYRPPFLFTGAVVTLASCAILLLGMWRWPRISIPA